MTERIREYSCRFCTNGPNKRVLLRYGAFDSSLPEYKELRIYQAYKKEDLEVKDVWHTLEKRLIGKFVKCRCASCGQFNFFIIVFNPKDIPKFPNATKVNNGLLRGLYDRVMLNFARVTNKQILAAPGNNAGQHNIAAPLELRPAN